MSVTVAMVSYNTRDELRLCLDALYANTVLRPLEVIVTDNASSDGSVDMLEARFPDVQVLRNEENVGFARASNRSWRAGTAPLVLFLNPDAIVQPGALDRMVARLEDRPDVGALGPKLLDEDGTLQLSHGRALSLTAELLQKCETAGYGRGRGPLRAFVERAYASEHEVDWVTGACLLTRRALLEDLGGFDETFFMYSEDADLCSRIRATGARVLFTPEAEVVHLLGQSSRTNREGVLFEAQRSRLHYYEKHHGRFARALLRSYMALSATAAYLFRPHQRALHQRVLGLALRGVQR